MHQIKSWTFLGMLVLVSYSSQVQDWTQADSFVWDPPPTWAPRTALEIKETLIKAKIIPDVLAKAPKVNANIMFYDLPFGLGRTLVPYQVKYNPTWFEWPHHESKLYTFIMTDIDFPTKNDPSGREFVLWIIGNIAGVEGLAGKQLTEYIGLLDETRKDKDLHRYLVTVYEQSSKEPIDFEESHLHSKKAIQNRTRFSTQKFAKKYKLGEAIAVDFAYVNVSGPTS